MSTLREMLLEKLAANGDTELGKYLDTFCLEFIIEEILLKKFPIAHSEVVCVIENRVIEFIKILEVSDGERLRYFKVYSYVGLPRASEIWNTSFEYQKLEDIEEVFPRITTTTVYE